MFWTILILLYCRFDFRILTMSKLYKNKRINMGKLLGKISDLKSQIKFLRDTNILPSKQTCIPCNKVLNKMCNEGSLYIFAVENAKREYLSEREQCFGTASLSSGGSSCLSTPSPSTTGHTSRWTTRCASPLMRMKVPLRRN